LTLRRPRALLFDWDNTLVDTWPAIHHALKATFLAMGQVPWTYEETQERVRASARDTFPALFGDRADEATEVFYSTYEAGHLEKLIERPGAGEAMRTLAAQESLYLAVVSNKKGTLLRREADHLGWTGYFSRLVGALDAARDKPAPEAVLMALEGSNQVPGPDIWFVGDTDIDMICAVNSGCIPVLVRPNPPVPGEFGGAEPHAFYPDCAALRRAVLGM